MKHFMLPLSREGNSTPFSELPTSTSTNPTPNPNPNPNSQKQKPPRKQKCPPRDKENSDPGIAPENASLKASPAGKIRSPLPPRPPSNTLKRKLSNDPVSDFIGVGPSSSSFLDSGVRVVVRMRPLDKGEEGETTVQKISNDSLSINGHTFTFDSVADTEATQMDIFELVGAPLVENCLAGFNSSVFAYGQTGSGKTYTMWGPANALVEENLANDQQGLTPRVFERLFARINEEQIKHADKQLKYQCRCSFLEIYNEQITDLLDPRQKNLQIREDIKTGVYVENLTEECVSTMKNVIQLLLKGLSNRRTGSTSINAESSRSHSVFTCVVESHCKNLSDGLSSFKTSRINLVDLAGSERQKLTGAAGERLKEAGNINRSLSQLGNLINILAEISQTGKQRHIPYRDSRLTFLLQESLGGNAKLAMICAISPAQSCKSETFSTLRFAQRAKAIKNKAVVNEVMQDDVNFLREVIRQLKDELLRMKAHGNQTDPDAAYANSWNARRSLNLLKFSLNHPMALRHVDADGDEVMEIDEVAVQKLCEEVSLQSTDTKVSECIDGGVKNYAHAGTQLLDYEVGMPQDPVQYGHIEKQASEVSDVSMEGLSEIHIDSKNESVVAEGHVALTKGNDRESIEVTVNEAPCQETGDGSVVLLSDSAKTTDSEAANNPPSGALNSTPSLSIVPYDVSRIVQSPIPSVSPRLVTSSRKSLRTSSMLTASQKDVQSCGLRGEDALGSSGKSHQKNSQVSQAAFSGTRRSTTEHLAASLHRGLEILENNQQSSACRRSAFRFSFKPVDLKPILAIEKVDVGIQAMLESTEPPEGGMMYLCSNCKNQTLHRDLKETNDTSDLQLVPVDRPLSAEKPKKQVPKAVEKVLAGAIRREMALEEFCARQTSEISQLNRLVQQYRHERECNAIISQLREEKIIRLENLMDGVLPSEDFMEEELASLRQEHELLKEKYENHPEVLSTKIKLKRVEDELERLRSFFDMGERDVLLEEIHDLRNQLQYYTDSSPAKQRKSLLQLTYPPERSSSPLLNAIPESIEENVMQKLEQGRTQWEEAESKWISLAEELKAELESTRSHAEQLKRELEVEKKCAEELKEAMQLAMQGHARMLEQYADLEEKHMQMLANQRRIHEGIDDVKRAAARAGVKGAESKFINALAAEIAALQVEREKERRYWREENKMLQAQLRDTAEAVQAAGELLVRLKEAEEAVAAVEKRAAKAEAAAEKSHKQMEKLKKKHKMEISTLNQVLAESHLPKEAVQCSNNNPNVAKYDAEETHDIDDERWKEEFVAFYDNNNNNNNNADDDFSSKFAEPSSWFSGYDKCNI